MSFRVGWGVWGDDGILIQVPEAIAKLILLANLPELHADYAGAIAPFDTAAAVAWGRARHTPEIKRQPQPLFDSL